MTATIEKPSNGIASEEATTAIAPIRYDAMAPVGNASGLKRLLETQKDGIRQALPRHVTPERLIKTLLVAANRVPDLLKCTQASVLETINRAAELGLDLSGTLGEAYPVPFNNKIKSKDDNGREVERWAMQCQLIIGYRGLAKLARQSGEIKRIEAEIVCENDHFVFRKGLTATLEFEPLLRGERGACIGAYSLVEFKDGGVQYDFMSRDQIEKVRAVAKSKDSPAWRNHWEEMAKKTVFRRVAKWLPLSTEKFVAAVEHDNSQVDLDEVMSVERVEGAAPRSRAAQLTDRLSGNNPEDRDVIDTEATSVGEDAQAAAAQIKNLQSKAKVSDSQDDADVAAEAEKFDQQNQKPAKGKAAKEAKPPKLNPMGQAKLDEFIATCKKETGAEDETCRSAVIAWLGSEGVEVMDLVEGKVREKMTAAIVNADWEQFV